MVATETTTTEAGTTEVGTTEAGTTEAGRDFIRDIVQADSMPAACARGHPLSARAQRVPASRPCEIDLPELRDSGFGGQCHLRFDDTNPIKEEQLFIDSIQRDVRWLGFDWGEHLYYASDYFEQLYEWAEHLVRTGKAYVDDTPAEAMRAQRGTLTEPGQNSPFRYRSVEENLDLFRRMRAGEFPNGARVLRAKIDMASGNMNLRDPVLYRILHAHHPRTGDTWSIYPTYDFAHGQSDAIEHVTHSVCTLEFEDHRPLYDWLIENLPVPSRPRQYEFARLNIAYTILSKRIWRRWSGRARVRLGRSAMPTLAGDGGAGACGGGARVRRAGRVARAYSMVDVAKFEHAVRDVLNKDRAAADGGAAAPEAGHREFSRGPDRNAGRGKPPRGCLRRVAAGDIRPRGVCGARRFHGEPAEEILPPGARAARCGCATRILSPAARW